MKDFMCIKLVKSIQKSNIKIYVNIITANNKFYNHVISIKLSQHDNRRKELSDLLKHTYPTLQRQ